MTRERPKRIAVLGGGVAALSAVHELTREPGWQDRYDITVYQLGWRLGGKARSGRNAARGQRIEEHGLHILLGFYGMTFRLLWDAYEYVGERGLGSGAPLGGLKSAIRQMPSWQLQEHFPGHDPEWVHWPNRFWTNALYPGEERRARADFFAASFVRAFWGKLRGPRPGTRDRPRLRRRVSAHGRALLPGALISSCSAGATFVFCLLVVAPVLVVIAKLNALYHHRVRTPKSSPRLRRAFYNIDLMCALLRGRIASFWRLRKPDAAGYRELDGEDFIDWLRRYGLTEVSAERSPLLKNLYKTIAHNTSTLAAGAALYTVSRLMFTWTGCPQYLMNAGMGDVVVAPVYQMLRDRGVRFRFFHRVTNLRLAENGEGIEAVEMVRQCRLADEDRGYDPLIPVQGRLERPIDCWPSEPLWDQIVTRVDGQDLRQLPPEAGLESFRDIPGQTDATIQRGRDFDVILNAIAIGAHAEIASELMAKDAAYDAFVRRGAQNAVEPAGGQVWLKRSAQELGWSAHDQPGLGREPGPILCGTYLDPIAGYTDMSQTLAAEDHGDDAPSSVAYFWGERADIPASFFDDERLDEQSHLAGYLEDHMAHFWPKAYREGRFLWDEVVHAEKGASGRDRIRDQYLPDLPSSSDRYNRVPAGSTATRLGAGDLYERWGLILAGDHTRTRFCIALVEGACESGIRAANVIAGRPETYRTIG
ncbi:MAG: NAD(P)-binding protein [Planctomycetota bacterium]